MEGETARCELQGPVEGDGCAPVKERVRADLHLSNRRGTAQGTTHATFDLRATLLALDEAATAVRSTAEFKSAELLVDGNLRFLLSVPAKGLTRRGRDGSVAVDLGGLVTAFAERAQTDAELLEAICLMLIGLCGPPLEDEQEKVGAGAATEAEGGLLPQHHLR